MRNKLKRTVAGVAALTIAFSTAGAIPQGALSFTKPITASAMASGCYNGMTWNYDNFTLTISGGGTIGSDFREILSMSVSETGEIISAENIEIIRIDGMDGMTCTIQSGAFQGFSMLKSVEISCADVTIESDAFPTDTTIFAINSTIRGDVSGLTIDGDNYTVESGESGENTDTTAETLYEGSYTESDGSTVSWSVNSNGKLTVSGTGELTENLVSSICSTSNYDLSKKSITSVVIENGITSIGEDTFFDYDNMKSVTIPSSVKTIGKYAFYHCDSLTEVIIPCGVETIEKYAFYLCSSLKNAVIPYTVKTIGDSAFYYCQSLTNITIYSSDVYAEDFAFYTRSSSLTITVPENNSITYNGSNCYDNSITTITKSSEINSTGHNIDSSTNKCTVCGKIFGTTGECTWAFDETTGTITVSGNGAMDNYKTFARMPWYSYASQIKKVIIEKGVTTIGDHAFDLETNLESVEIPEGVTYIGWSAFCNDSSLKEVTIPSTVTEIINEAFDGCSSLKTVTIKSKNIKLNELSFTVGNSLESIFIPCNSETDFSATINSYRTNSDVSGILTRVHSFDESTDTCSACGAVRGTTGECIWVFDEKLGTITISGNGAMADYEYISGTESTTSPWNKYRDSYSTVIIEEGVTTVGAHSFDYVYAVTSVSLPSTLTAIKQSAFCHCKFTTIDIPASVTTIESQAFDACSKLETMNINSPNIALSESSIKKYNSFTAINVPCSNETDFDVSESGLNSIVNKVHIPDENYKCIYCDYIGGTIGDCTWTFDETTGTITISGNGKIPDYQSYTSMQWNSYRDSIKHVVIEEGVTSIGDHAFDWLVNLEDVVIPEGVTSIGTWAFAKAGKLTELVLPSTLETLSDYAFQGMPSTLTEITIKSSNVTLGTGSINGTYPTINVPCNNETDFSGLGLTNYLTYFHNYDESTNKCENCDAIGGKTGDCTWTYDESTATITISGKGKMADYETWQSMPWYNDYRKSIKHVVIKEGVTYIGNHAFDCIPNLEDVVIPEGVTSIGTWAFAKAQKLSELVLPSTLETLGDYAFEGEPKTLTEITIKSSNVTLGKGSIIGTYLTAINVPCDSITDFSANTYVDDDGTIAMPDEYEYDNGSDITSKVVKATHDFDSETHKCSVCGKIGSIQDNYTWFVDDDGTLYISGTGSTPKISDLISEQTDGEITKDDITSLVIEEGFTYISDNAFNGFKNIKTVVIPSTVTYINDFAFCGCESLTEVTIKASSISTGRGIFQYDNAIEKINVPCDFTGEFSKMVKAEHEFNDYYKCKNCGYIGGTTGDCTWTYDKSTNTLTISGNGAMGDYEYIGWYSNSAPWNIYSCSTVIIEEGVTTVGAHSFDYDYSVTSVSLPSTLTTIKQSAFCNCKYLTSVDIPASVTTMESQAFDGCSSLATININSSNVTIGQSAIANYVLTAINVPCDSTTDFSTNTDSSRDSETNIVDLVKKADHVLTQTGEAKDVTCTEDGSNAYWTCESCGQLFADEKGEKTISEDDIVIKATGHNLSKVDAENETCVKYGNKEYWICDNCDKLFGDEKGENVIADSETVKISPTGIHTDSDDNNKCDTCNKQMYRTVALYSITSDGKTSSIADLSGGGRLTVGEDTQIKAEIKNGYSFKGWYTATVDGDGTVTYNSSDVVSKNITFSYNVTEGEEDVSLVAVYEANSKMSVTINGGSNYSISVNGGKYKSYGSQKVASYAVGTVISVKVNDSTDFAYWVNDSNAILSKNGTYEFTVSEKTIVTAVYNNTVAENSIVSFVSGYNQILLRDEISTDDISYLEIPNDPYKTGCDFVGWSVNGGKAINDSDELLTAIEKLVGTEKVITVQAMYKNVDQKVNITSVINDTELVTEYNVNDLVTLVADETVDGKKFAYWEDSDGKILGYSTTYNFYALTDVIYKAVYVDVEKEIEAKGTTEIISVTKDAENNKLSFVSMSTIPEGCSIVKAGVIATSNIEVANGMFDDTTATYVRYGTTTSLAYQFTWTKSKVTADQTWYVRAYLVYTDANGNTNTVYGDVVSANIGE